MQLEGKSVFITGGTGGIGTPLVAMLRGAGATVTAYDQNVQGDLVENLPSICKALAASPPDILINMAGFNDFNYAEDQDYAALLSLNLAAPMYLSQAVLPGMKARGSGHIVTIGSMTSIIPLPHLTGYVAAKAGLKGFSDSLRREVEGFGITVTHIVPRAVRTPMNQGNRALINERTKVHHDDPQAVARHIFEAIAKRKREVRIGWPERLFALINANFPRVIDLGLRKNRRIGEDILKTNPEEAKNHETEKTYSLGPAVHNHDQRGRVGAKLSTDAANDGAGGSGCRCGGACSGSGDDGHHRAAK